MNAREQMLQLEMINAGLMLSRYSTVSKLLDFWKSSGRNRSFPGPSIEQIDGEWFEGLF